MKKLKNKVFWVIFIILTVFTFIVFITSTTRGYMEKKRSVSEMLTKIPRTLDDKSDFDFDSKGDPRRIYLDVTIYSVLLDDEGNYVAAMNNTDEENLDEAYIKSVVNDINKKHNESYYVGNLYTSKYSYTYISDNILIIMDNREVNKLLANQLMTNIILLVLCEVIIFIVTSMITSWIITPVEESFAKQKMFVADASHELKTPISVIIASTDAYFNDKNEKWIKNIRNESERMIKLVTDLLNLAKSEQEQDLVMQENNLSEIIEGSILTFESLFYENNIKLDYEITPNIKLLCNENSIVELMSILMDNAVKHCSEKGKVIVNLSKKNKQIVLEVKNKGKPIKKGDEEKIFERFYKSDESRNRDSNNYGLGLAIAKNIVEKHNGEISANSADGYTTLKVIWNQK